MTDTPPPFATGGIIRNYTVWLDDRDPCSIFIPKAPKFLIVPGELIVPLTHVRLMLNARGRIRLRARLPWNTYQDQFHRPHPASHRVKAEYHRRTRNRRRPTSS